MNIKFDCHCGITPVYYKCGDYYKSDLPADERERMQSCGNRCSRNVSRIVHLSGSLCN